MGWLLIKKDPKVKEAGKKLESVEAEKEKANSKVNELMEEIEGREDSRERNSEQ